MFPGFFIIQNIIFTLLAWIDLTRVWTPALDAGFATYQKRVRPVSTWIKLDFG